MRLMARKKMVLDRMCREVADKALHMRSEQISEMPQRLKSVEILLSMEDSAEARAQARKHLMMLAASSMALAMRIDERDG